MQKNRQEKAWVKEDPGIEILDWSPPVTPAIKHLNRNVVDDTLSLYEVGLKSRLI